MNKANFMLGWIVAMAMMAVLVIMVAVFSLTYVYTNKTGWQYTGAESVPPPFPYSLHPPVIGQYCTGQGLFKGLQIWMPPSTERHSEDPYLACADMPNPILDNFYQVLPSGGKNARR